jgi:branched-chain amino acid transport system permease protein
MTAALLVSALIDGVILSGVYALAALGFVIIYRATGVFNFAQGEFMMLGAYAFYMLTMTYELDLYVSVALMLAGLALVGAGVYFILVRPLTGQPLLAVIIITMGLAILLRAFTGLFWGTTNLYFTMPLMNEFIEIGDYYTLSAYDLAAILICLVTYGAILALLRFSPIGLQMRATAESPTLASQRGVDLNLVFALSWSLAAVSAAVAGAVYAGRTSVSLNISHLGLAAFPAAIVGGFDSVAGTLLGAFVVGLAETFTVILLGAEYKDIVSASILLIILMVRPYGLLGARQVSRI